MSAEAAGYALADTLYRRQSLVLGEEKLLEAGERFVQHLNRRGYKLVYDPAMYEPLPEQLIKADPVPVPRLEPKPAESRPMVAVTLSIGDRDMRCTDCGCWSFYVKESVAFCSSCAATYAIKKGA